MFHGIKGTNYVLQVPYKWHIATPASTYQFVHLPKVCPYLSDVINPMT